MGLLKSGSNDACAYVEDCDLTLLATDYCVEFALEEVEQKRWNRKLESETICLLVYVAYQQFGVLSIYSDEI